MTKFMNEAKTTLKQLSKASETAEAAEAKLCNFFGEVLRLHASSDWRPAAVVVSGLREL